MKKNWLAAIIVCCIAFPAFSQTLFTYGNNKADAAEFLRAFNKNNQQPTNSRAAALREYLDLYINSRLKIREAYDKGFDTLPNIKAEVENLRGQIIENYMSDPQANERLTKEAFLRSLKDIHVAHIFIADDPSGDTSIARRKLNDVLKRLAKGDDFLTVAQQLSDDPSAKENKGDLNYITVFILPYEFENIVYQTAPGKYSKPYRSKAGYHIFKNLGDRKALGKIKIQQLLIAIPPGSDEAGKKQAAKLADSLYQRVLAGSKIEDLASAFSNDMGSAIMNGNVPDVAVGQYDPVFEKAIWALPKDGAISKPFLTQHGYHIVKRIGLKPIVTNPADKANFEELKQKVLTDDRWKTAKDFIYTLVQPGFKKLPYNEAVFWALSDSLLDFKPGGIGKSMTTESPLFKIKDTTFKVSDWLIYAQMNRYKADRSGIKPNNTLMDEFEKATMYQYFRDHLEEYNADFRSQMSEFRDGNLFFEIMQQEVWNKAQADSTALVKLYEKNKNNYNWGASSEAVVFFCSDEAIAKSLSEQLKKTPSAWKKMSDALNEKVLADSGRYEWSQIPGLGKNTPRAGDITPVTVNTADNTASFAYIIKVFPQPAARSFNEAKGLVMNDYQTILEQEWIKKLRKKYPVVVDQKVLAQISK
ncbi:MAG: peptidylprolyl isomerase [Chitinophagaceae bacterium]